MAESIYPIRYLHFACNGCKAEWTLHVDPPIRGIEDFKRFMDEGRMGPCPRNCGSRTCNVKFRLRSPASGERGERSGER